LHAPIILHRERAHVRDADDYSDKISAVLRLAQGLHFPL
jgi:hypothetical protein